jgi:hypothetical protein
MPRQADQGKRKTRFWQLVKFHCTPGDRMQLDDEDNGPTVSKQDIAAFIALFCRQYKTHRHATYFVRRPKDLSLARLLLQSFPADDLAGMVDDLLTVQDEWINSTDRGIGILVVKASWLSNRQAQRGADTARVDWFEECQAMHGGACGLSQQRHAERKWADAFKAREREAS